MMSVLEYSEDVSLSVKTILDLCNKLNINVSDKDDLLDDDAIIVLDNEIEKGNYSDSDSLVEEFDEAEEIDSNNSNDLEKVVVKNNKNNKKRDKSSNKSNNDYKKKRKEMYKHKDKLISNNVVIGDNVVLYKEGMTVSDVASGIGVVASDIIKKLMTLGMMMTLNQVIDYDVCEIIVADYNKVLNQENLLYSLSLYSSVSKFKNQNLV